MDHATQKLPPKPSARFRVIESLTKEILSNDDPQDFLIASEHQLCRRFEVSRVTIRLALIDLEHRGLIYRKQGKGTFARGRSCRVHSDLGILIKSPDALRHASVVDMIRGAQAVMTSLRCSLVLISASPLEWKAEMPRSLGAIIVLRDDITTQELTNLTKRHLPFVCIAESQLTIGNNDFFNLGHEIAKSLNEAALTGNSGEQVVPFEIRD